MFFVSKVRIKTDLQNRIVAVYVYVISSKNLNFRSQNFQFSVLLIIEVSKRFEVIPYFIEICLAFEREKYNRQVSEEN